MNTPEKSFQPAEQWQEGGPQLSRNLEAFIGAYLQPERRKPRYDALTEFHISGGSVGTIRALRGGTASIAKTQIFYEHNVPAQIHALVPTEKGGNLDIYLKGKALADFLRQHPLEMGS